MRLENKTIVVVGATGGIGKVLCREFIKEGANLVLVSRTEPKLLELKKELAGNTHVLPADVSDLGQVLSMFDSAKKKFGTIDGVVISVGTWQRLGIDDSIQDALKSMDHLYKTIFLPTFLVSLAAKDLFLGQKYGMIFNISSHAAKRPELSGNLSYIPAKAASTAFTLALRNEMNHLPGAPVIRTVDIQPAIVNTPEANLTPEQREKAVQPEAIAEFIIENIGNPAAPAEILFDSEVRLD